MEQNLFRKYTKTLLQRKSKIDEIIEYIKNETGMDILQEEIVLKKNSISFQISSIKKSVLVQKNVKTFLKEKGYEVKSL